MEDAKKASSKSTNLVHTWTHNIKEASTGPAQLESQWGPRTKRRSGHIPSSIPQKQSPVHNQPLGSDNLVYNRGTFTVERNYSEGQAACSAIYALQKMNSNVSLKIAILIISCQGFSFFFSFISIFFTLIFLQALCKYNTASIM